MRQTVSTEVEGAGLAGAFVRWSRALEEELLRGIPRGMLPYRFPRIAQGPEQVLVFTGAEAIELRESPRAGLYFYTEGILRNLEDEQIGGISRLTFPINPKDIPSLFRFPVQQPLSDPHSPNYDQTAFAENSEPKGYSKQAYFFSGSRDALITVGPSVPKVARLKNGAAQFWVASAGIVTQGRGLFEGARGISSYSGSAFFRDWPEDPGNLLKRLKSGFNASVTAVFKVVTADALR